MTPNFKAWAPDVLRKFILESTGKLIAAMPDEAVAEIATEMWAELQELKRLEAEGAAK